MLSTAKVTGTPLTAWPPAAVAVAVAVTPFTSVLATLLVLSWSTSAVATGVVVVGVVAAVPQVVEPVKG